MSYTQTHTGQETFYLAEQGLVSALCGRIWSKTSSQCIIFGSKLGMWFEKATDLLFTLQVVDVHQKEPDNCDQTGFGQFLWLSLHPFYPPTVSVTFLQNPQTKHVQKQIYAVSSLNCQCL